ncbi:PH domain-containing protein [Tautonia rosea]|uniref:hypothetical protein n=1 Tax=Tautonia rosea TaxID=2728037 RepID=UPI001474C72F|nr:hypothetical protein [Tautonia rosea]
MASTSDPRPTGPRSEEGKATSSRNAVTHGLTARRPLSDEEAQRLIVIADRWVAKHLPQTDSEEALIRSAAMEYVRYLRCVDVEEARLQPATREAVRQWEESRRHAIRRKAQGLRDDPETVVAQLQESAFGIDWLVRHWQTLLRHLDSGRGWIGSDLVMALRLMGRPSEPPPPHDVDARRLWELVSRVSPAALQPGTPPGLTTDADSLAQLRALIVDQIERLQSLRPVAWDEEEGPQRLAAETAALIDTSKDGQLRHRYRRDALRDMQRSLSMVVNLKVERSKMDTRILQQDRLAASTRSSSGAYRSSSYDEPAATDPRRSSAEPPQSRNELPTPLADAPADRHNPNRDKANRPEPPAGSSRDPQRTDPQPDAHPGAPSSSPLPSIESPPNRIEPLEGG